MKRKRPGHLYRWLRDSGRGWVDAAARRPERPRPPQKPVKRGRSNWCEDPAVFQFAGCPFPAELATQGFLFDGSAGQGKTSLKNLMTDPILRNIAAGNPACPFKRAIIYAEKPGPVLRHLRHIGIPDTQLAIFYPELLPLPPLAVAEDYGGAEDGLWDLATLLAPNDARSAEPFFNRAAALQVDGLANTLDRLAPGAWFESDILYAASDAQRHRWVLEQYEGNKRIIDALYAADNDRLRANVLFTLETHAKSLRVASKHLQAARIRGNKPFSFSAWMRGDEGTPRIVVVCHAPSAGASWGSTFVPMLLSTAIRALMTQSRHTPLEPNLTLVDADEFAQVKLPEHLVRELFAVGRELGAVVLVGIQSHSLLRSVYPKELADGLLANLSFHAHGATNDVETAQIASQQFGMVEFARKATFVRWAQPPPEPQVFGEPRIRPDEFLRENDPGRLRFYCRAPGLGNWRFEMRTADIARRAPRITQELLDFEAAQRAPVATFLPWQEEDYRRLNLKPPNANGRPWPGYLDPNGRWDE